MNSVKVDIVIPTFNRRRPLERALRALKRQDYPRGKYEVIVVDDHSNDGTKAMIEEFVKKSDLKISYYVNGRTKGQAVARNTGFQKAAAEFVASTDDDMEVAPDWISRGLSYFTDPGIAAVEGCTVSEAKDADPFSHNVSMAGGTYGTGNMFYRKAVLDSAGGLDESLNRWRNYGSHYVLGLRILEQGGKIAYGRDVLAHHPAGRKRGLSIIKDAAKFGAVPYLYKKYGPQIQPYLGFKAYRVLGSLFLTFLIAALISGNYLAMLVSFVGVYSVFALFTPGFLKSGLIIQAKTVLIYGISSIVATLAFLYGCVKFGVIPTKRMFKL